MIAPYSQPGAPSFSRTLREGGGLIPDPQPENFEVVEMDFHCWTDSQNPHPNVAKHATLGLGTGSSSLFLVF